MKPDKSLRLRISHPYKTLKGPQTCDQDRPSPEKCKDKGKGYIVKYD